MVQCHYVASVNLVSVRKTLLEVLLNSPGFVKTKMTGDGPTSHQIYQGFKKGIQLCDACAETQS